MEKSKENNLQGAVANADSTKEDRQFQLYKQLHEQFAVNDNNKTSNVISFLAAIFSVFVGYGFVFCHYDKGDCCLEMATIASLLILALVCILCLFFGYSTRRDQFITQDIRVKYSVELPYTSPYERKANKWNFLPDYYSIMFYACVVFMILLNIATVARLSSTEANTCMLIVVSAIILLIVFLVMTYYYRKYEDFKKRFNKINHLEIMFKTGIFEKAWNAVLKIFTVVVWILLLVIFVNIVYFSCNNLEFVSDINGDYSGIINFCNLDDYLNVTGTFFLALMATYAYKESLKMRERSSFNSVFTQLLSNHVAIFRNVAESNSSGTHKNVFADFYDFYKIPRVPNDLKKTWEGYCGVLPDGVKFSHAFKYVYHEVNTVYDEFSSSDDPMRKHYIKIIQANMNQDELFCYLINLLQHYYKSKGNDQKETGKFLNDLKESDFFEDLTREGGKYYCLLLNLQKLKESRSENVLLLPFKDLSPSTKNAEECEFKRYCSRKCHCI